ncbi:MAG: MFS transporter [Clostridia bacterium]|nr:MFS transporter [Clostridia bacterium]
MIAALLLVIYLSFISLGLPDSILGTAWPAMQAEWNLPLDGAGGISLFIVGGTIVSSFLSGYFIKRIGTGKIVLLSCLLTGLSLLGFSFAPSYIWLVILGVPLGLGGGTVDAALNNYVALHFKSHHMNWLHSFWGVGATIGPLIMGIALTSSLSWRGGYRTISIIQLSLAFILAVSLPLWKKHQSTSGKTPEKSTEKHKIIDGDAFKIKGVKYALAVFLFYCAIELSVGLWGSSFLIGTKGISADTAAYWISVYYASITVGRFISGFVSFKLSNKTLIRIGAVVTFAGTILMLIPLKENLAILPFITLGLGLSPIFPAMIHETPQRFGAEKSQAIIGYEMAFAYIGSAAMPPLFGVLFNNTTISILPLMLMLCALLMILCSEKINRAISSK